VKDNMKIIKNTSAAYGNYWIKHYWNDAAMGDSHCGSVLFRLQVGFNSCWGKNIMWSSIFGRRWI